MTPAITIDLGKSQPISGVSFHTTAGAAGVEFPERIFVLVSNDARTWNLLGDLTRFSRQREAPPAGFVTYSFLSTSLASSGRFVRLVVIPTGPFVFVDEIEVYRGPDELLTRPPGGKFVDDPTEFVRVATREASLLPKLRRRIAADLAGVRNVFASAGASDSTRATLETEALAVERAIPFVEFEPSRANGTRFPIGSLHGRVFDLQARVWLQLGLAGLVVWQTNQWDLLSPTAVPQQSSTGVALDVRMMSGEYRSGAVNLSNATKGRMGVRLRLDGLTTQVEVSVHSVPFTDTFGGVAVAAALPLAEQVGDGFHVDIDAGMHQQIWLTFHPVAGARGARTARLVIEPESGPIQSVPIRLRIESFDFPTRPRLHVGGWDYTNEPYAYDVGAGNVEPLVRQLRAHYVDAPWATKAVLPTGTYDQNGTMTKAPDDSKFRAWIDRWPDAATYFVFANVEADFAGLHAGTPAFGKAVRSWVAWWAARLRGLKIEPSRLALLLVDEPHSVEQVARFAEYAVPIRAANTPIVLWENPTWSEPSQASQTVLSGSNALSPMLMLWLQGGSAYREPFLEQQRAGKRLWFYSCHGGAHTLDPHAYYRLAAWNAWKYRAEGVAFWAFGDASAASSWDEWSAVNEGNTPLFLDASSATSSKQMEAIREGIEDFEYLRMLKDRIEVLDARGQRSPKLAAARALMERAAERALAGHEDAAWAWGSAHDRQIPDLVRLDVLDTLVALSAL